jgi:Cu-processing system ATP-binding protein
MPTVSLEDVTRHYGTLRALASVSLQAEAGEVLALAGHNGAGKTTLLKLLLGLIRPTGGRIQVLGEDPARGSAAIRRRVGYLPEQLAFSPALSGRELLRFYLGLRDIEASRDQTLLTRVGLEGAADRRVNTYSKGMRQRLGLAQAIAAAPEVLLLDEPTTGLDPELRRQFYGIDRDLAAAGTTVILSSHALAELESQADRIVILHHGRKIADGDLDSLRTLAQLPARVRLTAAPEHVDALHHLLAASVPAVRKTGSILEFDTDAAGKRALLQRLGIQDPRLIDIDFTHPSLDALYAHFLATSPAP